MAKARRASSSTVTKSNSASGFGTIIDERGKGQGIRAKEASYLCGPLAHTLLLSFSTCPLLLTPCPLNDARRTLSIHRVDSVRRGRRAHRRHDYLRQSGDRDEAVLCSGRAGRQALAAGRWKVWPRDCPQLAHRQAASGRNGGGDCASRDRRKAAN